LDPCQAIVSFNNCNMFCHELFQLVNLPLSISCASVQSWWVYVSHVESNLNYKHNSFETSWGVNVCQKRSSSCFLHLLLSPRSSGLGYQLVNNSQPADLALRKATPMPTGVAPLSSHLYLARSVTYFFQFVGACHLEPAPKLILDSLNSF
jgi:hypothetical protein